MHPDVWQIFGHTTNVYIDGLIGTKLTGTQGLFVENNEATPPNGRPDKRDFSVRNVKLRHTGVTYGKSQLAGDLSHILYRNIDLGGQTLALRDELDGSGKAPFRGEAVLIDGGRLNVVSGSAGASLPVNVRVLRRAADERGEVGQ